MRNAQTNGRIYVREVYSRFPEHSTAYAATCFSVINVDVFLGCKAHDDAIWTAAWGKSQMNGAETIVTGSLDDMVKVWKW